MKHQINKWAIGLQVVAIIILLVGVLFKIMHWPMASRFILFGGIGLVTIYFVKVITQNNTSWIHYLRWAVIASFVLRLNFVLSHWPYAEIIHVVFLVLFCTWFVLEIGRFLNSGEAKETKFAKVLRLLAWIIPGVVIAGAVMKIMHWPGAGIALVSGLVLGVCWWILDTFFNKH